MQSINNPKIPKIDSDKAKKAGGVLIAVGTIVKAGVELAKLLGKSK